MLAVLDLHGYNKNRFNERTSSHGQGKNYGLDHQQYYISVINSVATLSSHAEEENKSPTPQLLYTYETAVSGFAAKLSASQLKSLNRIDGFL
ncbi:hypothetical protein C1H46_029894 [Malus baccata]|uniref:Inhibitor I9 domain-containing protein n=1 Tax=Malus baccata TaxID=106549 RepID=A0A540LDL3_MALBA|nr:hypothetical protein C1H46_029894 [Malus baccata]